MVEENIGTIQHYFPHIHVAAVLITKGSLTIGDTIHIVGAHTDFSQKVESMQVNNEPVQIAHSHDEVGIKVNDRVREHDIVYKD